MASVTLLVAASLAVGGCGSTSNSSTAGCFSKGVQSAASGAAADWTLPGGNLANTRDVASPITSSNVAQLGVAWCVPVESTGVTKAAGLANGYATTPVVVNGVVYLQDLESNVMAIRLATGKSGEHYSVPSYTVHTTVNSVHSQAGYRRDGVLTAVDGDPADDLALEAHRPRDSLRGTQVPEQCQPVMTVSGYAFASGPAGGARRPVQTPLK